MQCVFVVLPVRSMYCWQGPQVAGSLDCVLYVGPPTVLPCKLCTEFAAHCTYVLVIQRMLSCERVWVQFLGFFWHERVVSSPR